MPKQSQLRHALKGYTPITDKPAKAPQCPYCFATAQLKLDTAVYAKSYGSRVWVCPNYPECDSYVGVHKATNEPLGRMANAELRAKRMAAHAAFDPIWKSGRKSRKAAYQWLADQMGIPVEYVHIGDMDVELCEQVIAICTEGRP